MEYSRDHPSLFHFNLVGIYPSPRQEVIEFGMADDQEGASLIALRRVGLESNNSSVEIHLTPFEGDDLFLAPFGDFGEHGQGATAWAEGHSADPSVVVGQPGPQGP